MPQPRLVLLPLILLGSCADDMIDTDQGDPTKAASASTSSSSPTSGTPPTGPTSGLATSGGTSSGNMPSEGMDPSGPGPATTTLTGTTGGLMMMDLGVGRDMGMGAGILPLGRWVLYDKDGMVVKAMATPTTYMGKGSLDFGLYEFSCTSISFWGQDYIGMAFELKTGSPKPCYKSYASWKDANLYYKDANCTQPVATGAPGYITPVYQIGGTLYYASTATPGVEVGYFWSAGQNTCTLLNLSPGFSFYDYKPVPNWVLGAMDAPPYTMVLEYD